ncbi:hypothetical protein [Ligilactobacillus agilis]|uniref:hypothetical protein n=1 Tax=Ligilactobacillus agilis TaxID=1601 RepID=UPI0022E5D723|nr:hypothetical protein [Ligilactobacillus agilis]
MVKAISLNGVKGTVTVDKDGLGTATFAGAAYKEGKGVINFTIDFGQGPYFAIQNVEQHRRECSFFYIIRKNIVFLS